MIPQQRFHGYACFAFGQLVGDPLRVLERCLTGGALGVIRLSLGRFMGGIKGVLYAVKLFVAGRLQPFFITIHEHSPDAIAQWWGWSGLRMGVACLGGRLGEGYARGGMRLGMGAGLGCRLF